MTKAEALKALAESTRAWSMDRHAGGEFEADIELEECYKADRKDLRNVARLIKANDFKSAYDCACYLDTIVRDQIPHATWDYMEQKLGID